MKTAEELGQKQTQQEMKWKCVWVLPTPSSHGRWLNHLDLLIPAFFQIMHTFIHSLTRRE